MNIKDDRTLKDILANPNLMYTKEPNIGNLRETFFVNQLDNYYKNRQSFSDDLEVGFGNKIALWLFGFLY